MRVLERRHGSGFAQEPHAKLRVAGGRVGKLNGHLPAQMGVLGSVDDAHTAVAQPAHDPVVGNGLPDHLWMDYSPSSPVETQANACSILRASAPCTVSIRMAS